MYCFMFDVFPYHMQEPLDSKTNPPQHLWKDLIVGWNWHAHPSLTLPPGPPTYWCAVPCSSLWASSWLWCSTCCRCSVMSPSSPLTSSAAFSPRPGGWRPAAVLLQVGVYTVSEWVKTCLGFHSFYRDDRSAYVRTCMWVSELER